jgi:AcrR family transcriptional regulator
VSTASTRRRGEALETAILQAVWSELRKVGYANLTVDAIAAQAGTSKPVLYRRWPSRAGLVLSAIRHHMPMLSGPLPDKGSLREDVLALLRRSSQGLRQLGSETLYGLLADLFSDAEEFANLQKHVLHTSADVMGAIVQRAMDRGEIAHRVISPGIITLPVDLARHEIFIGRGPVSDSKLVEIVDEVFMPLVRSAPATRARKK